MTSVFPMVEYSSPVFEVFVAFSAYMGAAAMVDKILLTVRIETPFAYRETAGIPVVVKQVVPPIGIVATS
jgi:hypothetical protein